MKELIFIITIIIIVILQKSIKGIELYPLGDLPKSTYLDGQRILTISSSGYMISENDGRFVSNSIHPNTSSLVQIAKFPNGRIITYNGREMSFYTSTGLFDFQWSYSISPGGNSANDIAKQVGLVTIDDTLYLLSVIDMGMLRLAILGLSHLNIQKEKTYSLDSTKNVQCVLRTKKNGFNCAFIVDGNLEKLTVYVFDSFLSLQNNINIASSNALSIKIKQIANYDFLICYITSDSQAWCSFFNENTLTLKTPTLVGSRIVHCDLNSFEIGIMSPTEMFIVYISNDVTSHILIQRIEFNVGAIGNSGKIIESTTNTFSNLNYLKFTNGASGLVYGNTNESINYIPMILADLLPPVIPPVEPPVDPSLTPPVEPPRIPPLPLSTCQNYCRNVALNTNILISFEAYTITSEIIFINLSRFGVISQNGVPIVRDKVYSTRENFEFYSGYSKAIYSAHFKGLDDIGDNTNCVLDIVIGEKGNCKCPTLTYLFKDECFKVCPSYTSKDETAKECINCKSHGQYLYKGKCIDKIDRPLGTFVTNEDYQSIEDCHSPCLTCSDTPSDCLSCIPGLICALKCNNNQYISPIKDTCLFCHLNCETCIIGPDIFKDNCSKCRPDMKKELISLSKNCVASCNNKKTSRWYIDLSGVFHCISSTHCPIDYPIYIRDTNQCVDSCFPNSNCIKCQKEELFQFSNSCVSSCPLNTVTNWLTYSCDDLSSIEVDITNKTINDILNNLNLDNYTNITIHKGPTYTIEINNSTNKGGSLSLSSVEFGECETILRHEYSISPSMILIFIKLDLERPFSPTNQVEYEVYDVFGNKLDLNFCKNITIDITYYIRNCSLFDIETARKFKQKGIDIYNPNDPFFNDICYPFSTDEGTDIILRDRMKDIYRNISLCEESCSYKSMQLDDLTVTCSCEVKPELKTEINGDFFVKSLTSTFTESNFMIVKCFNLLFNAKGLTYNIGFWLYICFLICHIPNWIYYWTVGVKPIKKYIATIPKASPTPTKNRKRSINQEDDDIVELELTRNQLQGSPRKMRLSMNPPEIIHPFESKQIDTQSRRVSEIPLYIKKHNFTIGKDNKRNIITSPLFSVQYNTLQKQLECQTLSSKKNYFTIYSNYASQRTRNETGLKFPKKNDTLNKTNSNSTQQTLDHDRNSEQFVINPKTISKQKTTKLSILTTSTTESGLTPNNKKPIKQLPSMDYLDDMDITVARLYETRSFMRLYYICLKNRHSFLSTFVQKYLLDLRVIIIITYLFEQSIDFACNALFFTKDVVSKRYHYEGNLGFLFDLQNNLIAAIVSYLISSLIGFLLSLLATSKKTLEGVIIFEKDKKHFDLMIQKILKSYKIKLFFFILLEFFLMLFFFYYVTIFCIVFHNSQISWFTGSLLTFSIEILLPFLISFVIIIGRKIAIKCNNKCLFRFLLWWYRF